MGRLPRPHEGLGLWLGGLQGTGAVRCLLGSSQEATPSLGCLSMNAEAIASGGIRGWVTFLTDNVEVSRKMSVSKTSSHSATNLAIFSLRIGKRPSN